MVGMPRSARILLAVTLAVTAPPSAWAQAPAPTGAAAKKPNILVIFGDDIGQSDVSAYTMGLMGFRTPNIDRSTVAK